jgi:group I intron endonuclease
MSQGIYKITNKINNKCYIGKSSNIEERWQYHVNRRYDNKEYNKPLYRALRKYGINNFSFEIIEELENYEQDSNKREQYWIKFYNSYGESGYNGTKGGDGGVTVANPRETYGKLTTEEVIYLRKRYLECKYPATYIWENEFKNKISKRGFQAIWLGENSKNIMPEVFTAKNKEKQIKLSRAYEGVLRRKVTLEEKKSILKRIKNGEACATIWRTEYQDKYKSAGGFRDMVKAISLDEEVDLSGKELDTLSL